MKVSHSGHLPYFYSEHHRGKVVEYAIRNLDVDPYEWGEMGSSDGAGSRSHVKL